MLYSQETFWTCCLQICEDFRRRGREEPDCFPTRRGDIFPCVSTVCGGREAQSVVRHWLHKSSAQCLTGQHRPQSGHRWDASVFPPKCNMFYFDLAREMSSTFLGDMFILKSIVRIKTLNDFCWHIWYMKLCDIIKRKHMRVLLEVLYGGL